MAQFYGEACSLPMPRCQLTLAVEPRVSQGGRREAFFSREAQSALTGRERRREQER
jgi:hypothetical protein